MSSTTSSSSIGCGSLPTLLTVLFVALKLTHVIDWSWWWVLSPTLIAAGFGLVILAVVLVVFLAAALRR
jgi:phosphoglycerol transferase MdoB-like AlkP superfamily enzyme